MIFLGGLATADSKAQNIVLTYVPRKQGATKRQNYAEMGKPKASSKWYSLNCRWICSGLCFAPPQKAGCFLSLSKILPAWIRTQVRQKPSSTAPWASLLDFQQHFVAAIGECSPSHNERQTKMDHRVPWIPAAIPVFIITWFLLLITASL